MNKRCQNRRNAHRNSFWSNYENPNKPSAS